MKINKFIVIVLLILALLAIVAFLVFREMNYRLSVDTSIFYSAGNDGNWSYVNQRKEFPNNEACYVRISSTATTNSFLGRGVDAEITVIYRFTGVENCEIEVAEGRMTVANTADSDVIEYTRVINAAREKEATESIVVFRYLPDGAEKVTLEVIYDDQIAEKYDALNNIYFETND